MPFKKNDNVTIYINEELAEEKKKYKKKKESVPVVEIESIDTEENE